MGGRIGAAGGACSPSCGTPLKQHPPEAFLLHGLLPPQDETSVHTGSTGTPGFAAPELLTAGKLTKAADIYSLALISEL